MEFSRKGRTVICDVDTLWPPEQIDLKRVHFQNVWVITGDDQMVEIPLTPPNYAGGSIRITIEFFPRTDGG